MYGSAMSLGTPIGRDAAIKRVLDGELPFVLGAPRSAVMVLEQEGVLRIRELVVDPVKAAAAPQQSARARSPSWMPEHHFAQGRPTGKIYAEATSPAELAEQIRTMPWPSDW